ncbi:MAG TPA: amidohydrolase/deacetylase family metallohydrolase [Thermomicrobiales bacterium]|jgi:dihydroorotase|nr:amidohydrolase/deacetylase family metallohydrolase [Thermomicrobiales bacterium]
MSDSVSGGGAELILKGGHVIDPASGTSGLADVAIGDGRVLAIGSALPVEGGTTVLDVTGRFVVPGIVDMHAHVFHTHRRSWLSLEPRVNTFSSGVTTVVDAGTSGWRDFVEFRTEVIERAKIRVLAFVNIVGSGMGGEWEHEAREMSPGLAAAMAAEHRDVVVGIKTAHYWANRPFDADHQPWTAVDAAVAAGERCGLPVMVDFYPWLPERPYPELILKRLRPGDIHTHVFAQQFPIIDDQGKVFDHLFQARERGVIFDLGHGAASFWFRNAVPAIAQGFVPDSISTDLHTGNVNGPVVDMATTMGKMLATGLTLEDVIARSTVAPAREIGRPELGTLRVGGEADVAVFAVDEGSFSFVDCGKTTLTGNRRLRCVLTVRAGEIAYNPDGLGLPAWETAGASRV